MDETNEAAPSSTEPVAVSLADLAALSVANMVAQQVSTPFIDQIATGSMEPVGNVSGSPVMAQSGELLSSSTQPAGELPNVGGAIADPSAVAPISTDAPSSPAAMSASGSAELPNVSPLPTGTLPVSTPSQDAPAALVPDASATGSAAAGEQGNMLENDPIAQHLLTNFPAPSDSSAGTPDASTTSATSADMTGRAYIAMDSTGTLAVQQPVVTALEGEDAPNAIAFAAAAASASGTLSFAPSVLPAVSPVSHPAHTFADQIHSLAFSLEGSADSMIGRMGYEIRTLVAKIKSLL